MSNYNHISSVRNTQFSFNSKESAVTTRVSNQSADTVYNSQATSTRIKDRVMQGQLECVHVSESTYQTLQNLQKELGRHPGSGRVNPLYVLFKIMVGLHLEQGWCKVRHATLGVMLPDFGYDKTLCARHVKRLVGELVKLVGFKVDKVGRVNQYAPSEMALLAYWFIVHQNRGRVQILLSEKKCPLFDQKNVPCVYKEEFYKEDLTTYIDQDVCSLNNCFEEYAAQLFGNSERLVCPPPGKEVKSERLGGLFLGGGESKTQTRVEKAPKCHIDAAKLNGASDEAMEQEIVMAAFVRGLSQEQINYAKYAMRHTRGIQNKAAYLAAMLNGLKSGAWQMVSLEKQDKQDLVYGVSRKTIERYAKPGESYQQAAQRLKSLGYN